MRIYAETCPRYVTLTEDDLRGVDMDMSGAKPDYIQATVLCLLFYLTLMLTGLLLLFVFFNSQRRALHDWFSGTIVVRRSAAA